MINRWEYKYGIIGSIVLLIIFTLKEIAIVNEAASAIIFIAYIIVIFSLLSVYMNYIKYSVLNENKKVLYSTIFLVSSTLLFNILELVSVLDFVDLKPETILSANMLMFFAIIIWSVLIVIKRKIYGRSLFLLGVVGILFSATYNLGVIIFLRFPLFYLFYICLIFPFIKKKDKKSVSLLRR